MATEIRRQTMLREIGIQCWFPRAALPGAGPSHDTGFVTDLNGQSQAGGAAGLASSAVSVLQRGQPERGQPESRQQVPPALKAALVSDADTAPVARQSTAKLAVAQTPGTQSNAGFEEKGSGQRQDQLAQAETGPSATDGQALEFAFSWFNVDKRLSVMAMLPLGADRLNSTCAQMLHRILAALCPEFKDMRGQEHTFHWPFPGDLGLPTGQQAARQAVDGFVARRLREQPSAMLLILADETPPFLYSDAAASSEDHNGALFVHRQFGFAMLRTHSLHAMESNNELKRSAWQAMQSLRDRLNRGAE